MPDFYEFFAGGGMVRAGLGAGWRCRFANDFDPRKAAAYRANWGDGEMTVGDVSDVRAADLPGTADLIWGSFPCQDLSLAGAGAGLDGRRSGAFWPFWRIIRDLAAAGRAPRIVAVENVTGAITSRGGADFAAMMGAFAAHGYRAGALVINADLFTPQSRPRLFVIGVREGAAIPADLLSPAPSLPFHTPALARAAEGGPDALWWRLPTPPVRNVAFGDLIEDRPADALWHEPSLTARLLAMMTPANRAKVEAAQATSRETGRAVAGAVYRRTRREDGARVQRAEARFDGVAGCLRTPGGGSSRQIVMIVEAERVRTRLISARETARLMGLDDAYELPARYNDAYRLTGDGVAAPVVRHLAHRLFEPLVAAADGAARAVA